MGQTPSLPPPAPTPEFSPPFPRRLFPRADNVQSHKRCEWDHTTHIPTPVSQGAAPGLPWEKAFTMSDTLTVNRGPRSHRKGPVGGRSDARALSTTKWMCLSAFFSIIMTPKSPSMALPFRFYVMSVWSIWRDDHSRWPHTPAFYFPNTWCVFLTHFDKILSPQRKGKNGEIGFYP